MYKIYVVVWSGGLEPPQYMICGTKKIAIDGARTWLADADPQDTIEILEVDVGVQAIVTGETFPFEKISIAEEIG